MIRLDATTRKLQIVLAGAITTNQLPVTVCYSDKTASDYVGGTQVSNTNSTTAVDICASPASSTVRDIDTISVYNNDTVAATITIRYNDNSTLYTLFKATLGIGDQLVYVHGSGWSVLDSSGSIKTGDSISLGASFLIGALGTNNSTTPNTKYDVSASQVQLRNPSTGGIYVVSNVSTITNNISTAGPAANGRDSAGSFSVSSWIHLYFIWNGVAIATLSSASAPSTGPTLPTGYTHLAYIGALRLDSSGNIVKSNIRGSFVAYQTRQVVLATGTASTETAIDLTSFIPPNALNGQYEFFNEGIASAGGAIDGTMVIRIVTGSNFFASLVRISGLVASSECITFPAVGLIPNVGQNLFYLVSATTGTPRLSIIIEGYYVPNGDS